MQINKNNYQAWILDYAEGNLNNDQIKELLLFIKLNPEYKKEFDQFELIKLEYSDNQSLSDKLKVSLKKTDIVINNSNIEEYAIKYLEGLLTHSEHLALKKYLYQHPEYEKLIAQYLRTKLHSGLNVYEDKLFIKKHTVINYNNAEYYIIAQKEGLLSEQETNKLNEIIACNEKLQKLNTLYSKTYFNKNDIYRLNRKDKLKKKDKKILYYMRWYATTAAACIVLYFFAIRPDKNIQSLNQSADRINKTSTNFSKKTTKKNSNKTPIHLQKTEKHDISGIKQTYTNNSTYNANKVINSITKDSNSIIIKEPVVTIDYGIEIETEKNPNTELLGMENINSLVQSSSENNKEMYYTPIEYTNMTLRKKYFSPDSLSTLPIKQNEILSLLSNGLTKITKHDVLIQNKSDDKQKALLIRLGKFEIYSSKNKQ
jgi:hypothetical protein